MAIKKNTAVKPDPEVPVDTPVETAPEVPEVDGVEEVEAVNVSRKDLAQVVREKVFTAGKAVPLPIAEIMVVAYEEAVTEALGRGEQVVLPGFGKFVISRRPGGERRNPATGEKVMVAPSNAAKFKIGAKIKSAINPK